MVMYRKKPVVVEAFQITNELVLQHLVEDVKLPFGLIVSYADYNSVEMTISRWRIDVETLVGVKSLWPNDWLIKGKDGKLYPCGDEEFKETYEVEGETNV